MCLLLEVVRAARQTHGTDTVLYLGLVCVQHGLKPHVQSLYIQFALFSFGFGLVFCFVLFCFVLFRFVSFRFVSFRFVSFRFVSFRFVSFRFVLFCCCCCCCCSCFLEGGTGGEARCVLRRKRPQDTNLLQVLDINKGTTVYQILVTNEVLYGNHR